MTTYAGMMDAMAEALGVRRRPRISVPVLTPDPELALDRPGHPGRPGVAKPLVEGLATDTVVEDPSGMELFESSRRRSSRR